MDVIVRFVSIEGRRVFVGIGQIYVDVLVGSADSMEAVGWFFEVAISVRPVFLGRLLWSLWSKGVE